MNIFDNIGQNYLEITSLIESSSNIDCSNDELKYFY